MGLLNVIGGGLTSMGTGVAAFSTQAGLEQQKASLAQQGIKLAADLAHQSHTAEATQAGEIAATAAQKEQTFQGGENVLNRQSAQTVATTGANATTGAASIAASGAASVARINANAPPDVVKLLRAVGALSADGSLPTGGGSGGASSGTGPSSGGGASSSGNGQSSGAGPSSGSGPATSGTSEPAAGSDAGASSPASATDSPIAKQAIAHALGLPLPGSEAAGRMAIADDVNKDPAFKYASVGQKAAEIETRFAVGSGKMADPTQRPALAAAIAGYQLAPLNQRALLMPGGSDTMKMVMAINPDYQEARYEQVNKAVTAFSTGTQGDTVRADDVAVQHLAVIDKVATALGNYDSHALNQTKNDWNRYFGSAQPTTFDGLKQVVATEVQKAVAGGTGSDSDREALKTALNGVNSPAQLQAMTDGFRSLMAGQLAGLKTQYEADTGFKNGPFAFETKLAPETVKALETRPGDAGTPTGHGQQQNAAPPAPRDPTARQSGASYLLPNGQTGTWAGTGWAGVH